MLESNVLVFFCIGDRFDFGGMFGFFLKVILEGFKFGFFGDSLNFEIYFFFRKGEVIIFLFMRRLYLSINWIINLSWCLW